MNSIEQRQIKLFCAIFILILILVITIAAWSSFGLNLHG